MRILSAAALAVLLSTGAAWANPGAIAVAGAAAEAVGVGEGGSGTGVGVGGESSSTGGDASSKDNSTTVGVALGQSPTAVSGICGKGNKFVFGVLEWTDFSSKCFNYMIAIEAAKKGEWGLANQWVVRADQM